MANMLKIDTSTLAYRHGAEFVAAGKLDSDDVANIPEVNNLANEEFSVLETGNTNEIGDLNLTYLLLAQRLVKEDAPSAMFRLGMSRELADLLGNLSLSQIVKLASSSLLLCRFRFDDHPIFSALTQDGKNLSLQQAHTAILLSGQHAGAVQ